MRFKKGNVSIGNISGVEDGTINISPSNKRGSGRVHVGNITGVSGGQINISSGNINQVNHYGNWNDEKPKKRKGNKKKSWWQRLFGR